jgi:2-C-methyl-D-erythritol 2,4-cyclodiphosphate synthase
VLTHALIDALLGALSLGDIGRMFPDSDEAYRGISSLRLLGEVMDKVSESGAQIANVDAVVMAQAPHLSPHIPAMVETLSGCLCVPPDRVSVKATTTESLGFVGRGEGIAAQAVVLLNV